MKNYIILLLIKPKLFFEELKRGNIKSIFPLICILAYYSLNLLVANKFREFEPAFFIETGFEFTVNILVNLVVLPFLLIIFLKNRREKHLSIKIFKAVYSIYLIGILGYLFILLIGSMKVLTSIIFFSTLVCVALWESILLILGIHIISDTPKIKATTTYLFAIIVVVISSFLIKEIPKRSNEMRYLNTTEEQTFNSSYYTVNYSKGKILKYNMNPLREKPDPIRCLTEDGQIVNVSIEIIFSIKEEMLNALNEKYSNLKGNYEPEMNFQISETVKDIVASKYAKDTALNVSLDELKEEIEKKLKKRLSEIGIDLIHLKIQIKR